MACAGIDFGNKTSVVAIARRGGIDICANEVSNRATPSMISFLGEERHIGEAAASIAAQNHLNTVASIQRLLGVPRSSPFADAEAKHLTCPLVSYPETASSAVKVSYAAADAEASDDGTATFSFEAMSAMLFSTLMSTASAEYKAPVRDLVISVPVYYTHAQRLAVLHAATIANVNVLRIMNEHAAIALSYGIFRTKDLPETTPIKVAFVDIGEASTTVSITAFTNTRCDVLAVATDSSLGGRDLDEIIVNKFAKQFKETYSIDVLSKPKPTARLRKESEKIKKVLSANPRAPLNLECLMNDIDVTGHINRDELEEIAVPLLARVRTVCEKAIADAGLKEDEKLTAVEVVGGSTRVPALKNIVGEVFEKVGAPIRTTLNADECIARGCALMSAMLSPAFKVRDYAVSDIATHTLNADKVFTDGTPVESLTLVPKGNAVPCVKVMKFKAPGVLTVGVRYDDASSLPAGGELSQICSYVIDAPVDSDAKVHAKVRVTPSGTVEMASAQLVKEVEEEEEVVVPQETTPAPVAANGTGDGDATMPDASGKANDKTAEAKPAENGKAPANADEDKMETDSVEGEKKAAAAPAAAPATAPAAAPAAAPAVAPAAESTPKVVTEKRMVKKKKTTDLKITPLPSTGCGLSPDMVTAATEKEAKMRTHDLYIKERSEAMNGLEAYVYDLRSRIDEYGGDLKEYGPSGVRDSLRKELDESEEWIYSEEAEDAMKSRFVERKGDLVKKAWPMLFRKKEDEERPVRVRVLEAAIERYKQVVVPDAEDYAHIKQEEKDKLLKCVEGAALWLKAEMGKQASLAKNVDPVLTCDTLIAKLKEIDNVCGPIQNTPKPVPEKTEEEKKVEGVANGEKKDGPDGDGGAKTAGDQGKEPAAAEMPAPEEAANGDGMDVDKDMGTKKAEAKKE